MSLKVFGLCLLVRLISVYLVRTFFVPDEYFQSLEVGHKISFGYGYTTWEFQKGVRSYFYPALIAGLYKILALLQLDTTFLLVLVPRVFQAIISAYSDYRFYIWTNKSKWGLFVVITSWFWFYTGSRTLINTLECALTTIALSYFPWYKGQENTGFLWIVTLLCYIRPTALLSWIPLCIYHIKKSDNSVMQLLFKRYIPMLLVVGAAMCGLDSYFHNGSPLSFIFTPLEFVKVNVINEIGSFYGTHPWYWYFNSGLPAILGIGLIPFLLSVFVAIKSWDESKHRQVLLMSIMSTIFMYSLLPHKEFGFLLQILPMCLYCISQFMAEWSRTKSKMLIWLTAVVILISNVVPAGYLGVVHQQGTIRVMNKLSDIAQNYKDDNGNNAKIFFMMPCHSTPLYSHVHANVSMRFLTCEPNFDNKENYLDEADQFFKEPMKWIRSHLPVHPVSALPTHVVLFDTLAPRIGDFLSIYKPVEVFFHADHLLNNRGGKNVILYEKIDATKKPVPQEKKPVETEADKHQEL